MCSAVNLSASCVALARLSLQNVVLQTNPAARLLTEDGKCFQGVGKKKMSDQTFAPVISVGLFICVFVCLLLAPMRLQYTQYGWERGRDNFKMFGCSDCVRLRFWNLLNLSQIFDSSSEMYSQCQSASQQILSLDSELKQVEIQDDAIVCVAKWGSFFFFPVFYLFIFFLFLWMRVEVRKTNNFCCSFLISWKWGWNVEGCCCDF